MKIGDTIFCVVNESGEILGDGECQAISSLPPDDGDLVMIRRITGCENPQVVKCRIVRSDATVIPPQVIIGRDPKAIDPDQLGTA